MNKVHYTRYIRMTIFLLVVFGLGLLIVEAPFGQGLRYFGDMKAATMQERAQRIQYQKVSDVRVAGFEAIKQQNCMNEYRDCASAFAFELRAGSITEEVWAENQARCEALRDTCVTTE